MPPELKLTILVDDQGTVKINSLTEALGKLERAAKQSSTGLAAGGKEAAAAGVNYAQLGSSVAMAQAKLMALYGAVRGAQGLFSKGMEAVDYYEKAIIRMAASATDAVKGITEEADLAAYYERQKSQFRELVNYAQEASAKYFANAREILQVAEWAVARGHPVGKKEIDNIGLLVDKIKQLVPWIKQEGQVLQELNALWEGHARVTDTLAKLVVDRLKQMGQITATEGKEVQEQFQKILAGWKEEGFGGFLERVMGLFKGAQLASKDVQNTWESTLETMQTAAERLASVAGKEIYRDIIQYLQAISQEYLTGEQAAEKQRAVADAVNVAWRTVKATLADLRPVMADIGTFLGEAWKSYAGMPEEVREVGMVGFLLVGTKGKALIIAVLGMLGRVETLIGSIRAYASGNLSLGDVLFGNKEKLDEGIRNFEEYQRRLENLREFQRMDQEPGLKKSPIRLMGWEESDNPFGAWEDLIELTGGAKITKRGESRPWGYIDEYVDQFGRAYEEIDSKRRRLDEEYYGQAIGKAKAMYQEVGSIYDGMLVAARKYFAESTNLYRAGEQIFADFTRAGEKLLGDFFDVIIWKTGNFRDAMRNFLKSLGQSLLDQLVIKPIVGLISLGLGSILNLAVPGLGAIYGAQMFGGTAAGGGQVSGGGPVSGEGGAMMGIMAAMGLGGMAAMMSGEERASESSLSTMTVETIQVANLTVESFSLDGAKVTSVATTSNTAATGKTAALGKTNVDGVFKNLFSLLGWIDAEGFIRNSDAEKGLAVKNEAQWRSAFREAGETLSGRSEVLLGGLGGLIGVTTGEWDYLKKNNELMKLGTTFKTLGKDGKILSIEGLGVTAAMLEQVYVQKMEGEPDWYNKDPGWIDSSALKFTTAMDSAAARFTAAISEAGDQFSSDVRGVVDSLAKVGGLSGGGGRSGGILSRIVSWIDIFHDGGWPRAHDGLWLGSNEIPIIAEEGERVVSRREVARVGGRRRLDALLNGGNDGGARLNIVINVNALDSDSVSRLDWERLVRSRVAPVLDKLNRRRV